MSHGGGDFVDATGRMQKVTTDRPRRAGELGTVQVTAQRSKDGELTGSWRIPVLEVGLRQGQRDLCLGSSYGSLLETVTLWGHR